MRCIVSVAAMTALLSLAGAPAFAQQLQRPVTPASSPVQGTGIGPQLKTAQPAPSSSIPANPGQRPQSSAPIPSTGPSVPPPTKAVAEPVESVERTAPKQVRDDKGRYVPGAIQVSPTRAYDPASGRYFPTMPAPKPG